MRVTVWIRALRAPFFQAVVVPLLLGSAVAWYQTGRFHWGFFLLALAGVVCVHAGTNLTNDFFDHRSGADELNREYTQFSGGSRLIQQGVLSARSYLVAALAFFALAGLIGLYLTWARGWPLLVIGAVGVASGYFYTASPFKLGYRGWGELLTGINCGPLVVLGAYYVQAQELSWQAVVAALPVGILIAAVLYVNEFSDHDADKAAGKAHLVVRLGPRKAVKGVYFLFLAAYVAVAVGCSSGAVPWPALSVLLTAPLAWWVARSTSANWASRSGQKMTPAMAGTIATHLLVGLLLTGSYLAAGALR